MSSAKLKNVHTSIGRENFSVIFTYTPTFPHPRRTFKYGGNVLKFLILYFSIKFKLLLIYYIDIFVLSNNLNKTYEEAKG